MISYDLPHLKFPGRICGREPPSGKRFLNKPNTLSTTPLKIRCADRSLVLNTLQADRRACLRQKMLWHALFFCCSVILQDIYRINCSTLCFFSLLLDYFKKFRIKLDHRREKTRFLQLGIPRGYRRFYRFFCSYSYMLVLLTCCTKYLT